MKRYLFASGLIVLFALLGRPAAADDGCSVRSIAGNWLFATDIGRQMLGEPFPPDKDITALGTMHIGRDGTISGTFDVTVQDFAFLPGIV